MAFKRWTLRPGVAVSAQIDEPRGRGIYVLEFANGQEYVGQTVNLGARLSSHLRRWHDIKAVRFTEATLEQLDDREGEVLSGRNAAGASLRNITRVAQPAGPSPLDYIVDPQVQAAWLDRSVEDDEIVIGDRAQLADRRRAARARFEELAAHPLFADILESLVLYVANVIVWPHETEGRQWTLTALPSTARRANHHRLATLNIQNVEMLVIGEVLDSDGTWRPYTRLNVMPGVRLPNRVSKLGEVTDFYRSAGKIFSIETAGVTGPVLLSDRQTVIAARHLAHAQLRKGKSAFSRHHNDLLADEVFREISARI